MAGDTVRLVWDAPGDAAGAAPSTPLGVYGDDPGNRVVWGDNLAGLRALVSAEAGTIQCAYLDPPYNTGSSRVPYPDDRSHAAWLQLMAERLELVRASLAPTGSLFVHLDDNEVDYLKVLLDQTWGRDAFISRITVAARAPSAFSTVNRGVFKAAEYLLWYARDRARVTCHPGRAPCPPDRAYNRWIDNPDDPPAAWTLSTVAAAFAATTGSSWRRAAQDEREAFVLAHAARVVRLAAISDVAAGRAIVELKRRSREAPGRVHTLERGPELAPVHALDGQQLLSYARNVAVIDGVATASRPLTNVWDDVAWEGIAGEGGVQLKQGKKPERLLRRVLELTTRPGDRVLDPFAGSGTTGAVAHKIGRRYVLMESDARCATHVVPRLVRVVDGDDHTGISEEVGWRGGGGFCVYGAPDHAPFTGPGWR